MIFAHCGSFNKVDLIIRAHEVVDQGYLFFAGGHLATVFSARNYAGQHANDGAFFIVRFDAGLKK